MSLWAVVPALPLCTTMATGAGHAGKKEGEAEMVWKDCLERQCLARFALTKIHKGASDSPLVICAHYEA